MPWWSTPYGMILSFGLVVLLVLVLRTHIWRNLWTLQRRTQSEVTRVFVDVYKAIDRGGSIREILLLGVRTIARQLGAAASLVQLLDEEGEQIEEVSYNLDVQGEDWGKKYLSTLSIQDQKESIYVRNVRKDPTIISTGPWDKNGFTSFLYVPVVKEGKVRGRFWVLSRKPLKYPRDKLDLLSSLAGLQTLAVERMDLIDVLKAKSYQDDLTGLYNRRYFHLRLSEEIARSARGGEPVSLLISDLDNFRTLNEVLGHQGGDKVLREVGKVTKSSVRACDIPTRYGGDEFAIILPEADSITALKTSNRLLKAVQKAPSILDEASPFGVTMSIGLASFPEDACSIEDLISKADRAMLSAKHYPDKKIMSWKMLKGTGEEIPSRISSKNIVQELAYALAEIVDRKDGYIFEHSRLVSEQSVIFAKKMKFDQAGLEQIQMAALLHDVGKFAVPEEILNRSTPLSKKGWEGIKVHSIAAVDILRHIRGLRNIIPIVKSIHENYDGSGYPEGLEGENIPIEARIIAVVDAYWAMRTPRPYRGALTHEETLSRIKKDSEKKYDPKIISVFIDFCQKSSFKEGVKKVYNR